MIPTLRTERLTLRAPGEGDYPAFADFYASDRSCFYGGPTSREEAWRKLAMYLGHWNLRGYGPWAIDTQQGAFVGMAGGWFPVGWPEREITYWLTDDGAGKGYGTEAVRAALGWLYAERGWTTAISAVNTKNTASSRLAMRCGAVLEGAAEVIPHATFNIYRYPGPMAPLNT